MCRSSEVRRFSSDCLECSRGCGVGERGSVLLHTGVPTGNTTSKGKEAQLRSQMTAFQIMADTAPHPLVSLLLHSHRPLKLLQSDALLLRVKHRQAARGAAGPGRGTPAKRRLRRRLRQRRCPRLAVALGCSAAVPRAAAKRSVCVGVGVRVSCGGGGGVKAALPCLGGQCGGRESGCQYCADVCVSHVPGHGREAQSG